MAPLSSRSSILFPTFLIYVLLSSIGPASTHACYSHLFSFGDSITDTGNQAIFTAPNHGGTSTRFPYGENFFHHPTGRHSDGRLIVDFIAEALQMPFQNPYLSGKTADDFQYGTNFAFSGGTALNGSFFQKMGLDLTLIPSFSLEVQMEKFKEVLNILSSTNEEREKIMSSSLFLMGEIGGNDYNHPFFQNKSLETDIKPLVSEVVRVIGKSIELLIKLGAKTLVVPGNFPTGCIPRYLVFFESKNPYDYDRYGCLKWLNDFCEYHNRALIRKLEKLRLAYPGVSIAYADYFGATLQILDDPVQFGFEANTTLRGCCGDGGPYNSNSLFACGSKGYNLCPNPSGYISWDGLHFTEHTYQLVAISILNGPYASPPILSTCKLHQGLLKHLESPTSYI